MRYIFVGLSLKLVRISTRYTPPRAGTSARARVLVLWLLSGRGHDALQQPPERRGGVWRSRGAPPRDGGSSDLVPPRRALEAAGHAAFKVFEAALAAPCERTKR